MKSPYDRHDDEGMALLLATIFMTIAVLMLGALMARVVNQSRQVDHFTSHENCMFGVETALARCQASLENGEDGMIGVDPDVAATRTEGNLTYHFDETGVTPFRVPGMQSVEYFASAQDWKNDGLDNNGDGVVDGVEEQWIYTMYAYARDTSMIRNVEVVCRGQDVNVWRNAIFAGAGQAGGLINGNVSIHGSVHLLGDNIIPGNEAITALDLSGTSLIHNNYTGVPADLAARVPALPTRVVAGETVSTLNAQLRVRAGLVGLSGNSEIGEPNVVGNGTKEKMDGTFASDGWTGTAVVDDGGRGDPKSVYSDNGWDTNYDLGTKVPLPYLEDDWRDPKTGAKVWNPATNTWYKHSEYFSQVLVATATNPTDGIYNGSITIQASSNFYYNASRPTDTNPANRLSTDDYILFNAATNRMEINGQLTINGNLIITRGGGNDKTISYSGRGALLVNGDVTLDTDLLSINSDGTTANSFPVNNILGVMARGNMVVGSLSQLQLMGAFYAQGRIQCSKQSTVMGTFVSNYFDMGTNVPSIYQVPTLADNLPLGMIGAYPILAMSQISWREL